MRALDDAVRAGRVLYIGISDTPAWVVARANTLAEWPDGHASPGSRFHTVSSSATSNATCCPWPRPSA
jgi:aryl-alcohol dehydrogenase-like predicted oxidoreductase